MSEGKNERSSIGNFGLYILTALAASILLFGMDTFLSAPEQVGRDADATSLERNARQQDQLDGLRIEIDSMRKRVGIDGVELEQLRGELNKREAIDQERWAQIQKEIARIEARSTEVVKYLESEQQHQELIKTIKEIRTQ